MIPADVALAEREVSGRTNGDAANDSEKYSSGSKRSSSTTVKRIGTRATQKPSSSS